MTDALTTITAGWREQAENMLRTAKAYKRSCVEGKASQLILCARQLQVCADQIDNAVAPDVEPEPEAELDSAGVSKVESASWW